MSNNPKQGTFVGRAWELQRFAEIQASKESRIVVVYGRRRVGKTTLTQKAYEGKRLLFFEGIQGQNRSKQLKHFAEQLAQQLGDLRLARVHLHSWKDAFMLLADQIQEADRIVYLEELQWMADYQDDLVADLKYVWDNLLQKKTRLTLILCGSSPSFLVRNVMHSKALHNRSQWEIPVHELPFIDALELLRNKGELEQLDGYLAVGGIPEYLKKLRSYSSVYLSLANHAYTVGGYFLHEAERVFVSGLADRPGYRAVIECLAKRGSMTKNQVLAQISESSGGGAKDLFEDLKMSGFIYPYSPMELGKVSRDCRWMIRDAYLQFYFRLIAPKKAAVERGEYQRDPTQALSHTEYRKWLGLALERFCIFHHRAVASALGFAGVEYNVGPFYVRNQPKSGQLDLVFERKDRVITVCEVKYTSTPPSKEIVRPFEESLKLLPLGKKTSIQRVLISPTGCSEALLASGSFDQVIDWARLKKGLLEQSSGL
jgi:uncharacterized protein